MEGGPHLPLEAAEEAAAPQPYHPFQVLRAHSLDNLGRGQAAPPPAPTLPTLKPIKQACEQFNGPSGLCLCQTLMNTHYLFFFFLLFWGLFLLLQKPHRRLMP